MEKYRVEVDKKKTVWYKFGTDELHRLHGPAVEHLNGSKEWHQDGLLHREDGPAVEYIDGNKSWCLNGQYFSEQEFLKQTQKNIASSCEGKIIEIEGKKYKLLAI